MKILTGLLFATLWLVALWPATAGAAEPLPTRPIYNANAPAFTVVYNAAQKAAQRQKTRALIGQINRGIEAGQTDFSCAPGVYRIPKDGPDNQFHLAQGATFNLRASRCEFFLESDEPFLRYDNSVNQCDISLIGPAKFDMDPLVYTQGSIVAYDAQSGLMTVRVAPGYPLAPKAEAVIESYSPRGVYLENPSWLKYRDGQVTDPARRLVQVRVKDPNAKYAVGNLVTLLNSPPLFFNLRGVRNFTVRDIDLYGGGAFMWGGGRGGDWKFERVRGVPRPGTNRLRGVASCQVRMTGGARVRFEGCSFSNTTDDLIDFAGEGIAMNVRQNSPREIVTWLGYLRGGAHVGDWLDFYAHGDLAPRGMARVMAVEAVQDPALQSLAHDVVKTINKGRELEGEQNMQRVTLDRDADVGAGDFVANRADGMESLRVSNCYFSNSAVRVMMQGFRHGLFENNRFERVSGGLAMTLDTWWWGGPVVQDVTIRGNVFRQTTFGDQWGTGRAAIAVGTDKAPARPATDGATHRVVISGNRIWNSSRAAIFVGNATDVTIANNRITGARTPPGAGVIALNGVARGAVTGNVITSSTVMGSVIGQSGAKTIAVANSSDVEITGNAVAPTTIEITGSHNTTASKNAPISAKTALK